MAKDESVKTKSEAEEQAEAAKGTKDTKIKAEAAAPAKDFDPNAYLEEYVEIMLFKDNDKYKDDLFVSVNGQTCLIKRGVPVRVKRKFAQLIDSSQRQDLYAAQLAEKFANDYREESRKHA